MTPCRLKHIYHLVQRQVPNAVWERQTCQSLRDIPQLTAYHAFSMCLLPIQRYPQSCAEFMWLLHFKSWSTLIFLFQPIKINKIIPCWHPPCACHLQCTPIVRCQKKQLSHTSDNSYHPGVNHVGFPWHLAANPMQIHTCCSFTLISVVRMNRNETLRSTCLSREIAFRVGTDSWSVIHCS